MSTLTVTFFVGLAVSPLAPHRQELRTVLAVAVAFVTVGEFIGLVPA